MSELEACQSLPKTIQLDPSGSGALIDYEMYQRVCFPFYASVLIDIEKICVKDDHHKPPKGHFWQRYPALSVQELREYVRRNFEPALKEPPSVKDVKVEAVRQLAMLAEGREASARKDVDPKTELSEDKVDQVVARIQKGERPVLVKRMSGEDRIEFEKEPERAVPELRMILHYRTCIFSGRYGLGKVVGSMDLLPGESREISIQTYEHSEESRSRSESIFDSFSASSAASFENSLTNINKVTTDHSSSEGKTPVSWGVDLGVEGLGSLGFNKSGGKNSSVSDTTSTSAETISSAIATHSSEANAAREIKIGTETSSSIARGTDSSLIRHLKNENLTRCLNFFFRQCNQVLHAITFIDNVSFVFRNGYESHSATLETLPQLIDKITPDNKDGQRCAEKLLAAIRIELCNIKAYDCKYYALIECHAEELTDCCDPKNKVPKRVVMRKKCGLQMNYDKFTVPGIIIGVKDIVMRTPAVFVDTVMGQNESLDCYNSRLQNAAAESREIDNQSRLLREKIISSQLTPQEQKEAAVELRKADCCPSMVCGD